MCELTAACVGARNLASVSAAPPDTFASVTVLQRGMQEQPLFKTGVVSRSRHPNWTVVRSLSADRSASRSVVLKVEVFERKLLGRSSSLGVAELPMQFPGDGQDGVAVDSWLLLEGPGVWTGEVRMRASLARLAAPSFDPEEALRVEAVITHPYDRFGVPIKLRYRREWHHLETYLACREMRQLRGWGQLRLDGAVQQTPGFFKLLQLDRLVWLGVPRNRRLGMYSAGLRISSKRDCVPRGHFAALAGEAELVNSESSREVAKDVARTGQGKDTFVATDAGKAKLQQVLASYAIHNSTLG